MTSTAAVQPGFFDDQYLGAEDMNAIITYLRTQGARARLSENVWGVAAGLHLVATDIGGGDMQISVSPGVAIDGFGRLVAVTEPAELPIEKLAGFASGEVKVWIRYAQREISGQRKGFDTCLEEDAFSRIEETFELEVGDRTNIGQRQSGITVAGAAVADARTAARQHIADARFQCDGTVPYQELPVPAEDTYWMIPLGIVDWRAAANAFAAPSEELQVRSRAFRRQFGAVAETINAANGLLRLRDRDAPEAGTVGDACADYGAKSKDFVICDGDLKARELVWLEGATRVTGDLRLFGTRLELRDGDGRDYVDRTVDGALIEASAPLYLDREANGKDGDDLRVLLGKRPDDAPDTANRFTIGSVEVGGSLCAPTFDTLTHVVVEDNGMVGIGTAEAPDSTLSAPLTIRGRQDTATLTNEDGDEVEENIWRVLHVENDGGDLAWETMLWTDGASLTVNQSGQDPGTLYLQDGGNLGVGTTEPEARLEIARTPFSLNSALGTNLWLRVGDGGEAGDEGRFWVEYGSQNAPLLVLSDHDNPPRIQFQQTGAGGDETAPDHVTWIGHLGSETEDFGIIGGGQIGLLTESPYTDVTIGGSLGFKNGSEPLIYIFESGVANPDRMALAHSPDFPEWGLKYQDAGDRFQFQSSDGDDPTLHIDLFADRVGINTDAPAQALDVRGSVKLGDAGELFALGAQPNFRVVAGEVQENGVAARGTQFVSLRLGEGLYRITFTPGFASPPFVVACALGDKDNTVTVESITNSTCNIRSFDTANAGVAEGDDDSPLMFIAMGAR